MFQLPEASSQALFADSQAHIWALEGKRVMVGFCLSEIDCRGITCNYFYSL